MLFNIIPTGYGHSSEPLVVQYGRFWWDLVGHGSFGASSLCVITATLLVDLVYAAVDPRIRVR
ncbi:MAG: hypothetical protein M3R70_11050 [Actinomycetota bacterium]|nr:hypothetical protein [Actinomycetota bacterium]